MLTNSQLTQLVGYPSTLVTTTKKVITVTIDIPKTELIVERFSHPNFNYDTIWVKDLEGNPYVVYDNKD